MNKLHKYYTIFDAGYEYYHNKEYGNFNKASYLVYKLFRRIFYRMMFL